MRAAIRSDFFSTLRRSISAHQKALERPAPHFLCLFVSCKPTGQHTFQVRHQPPLQGSGPCLNQPDCLRRHPRLHPPKSQRHIGRRFVLEPELVLSGLHMLPRATCHQAGILLLSSSCRFPYVHAYVLDACFWTCRVCSTALQPVVDLDAKTRLVARCFAN